MADDKNTDNSPRSSHVNSLIDRLNLEISKDSDDDFIDSRKLTIHSTNHRHELATNSCHDIDREINELENLIKKLQTEIVEMTKSANKALPNYATNLSNEKDDDYDDDDENQEVSHSPVKKDDGKEKTRGFKLSKGPHNPDIVFPILIKDDSVLEEQAKLFAENMANLIKVSDPENHTLDDVRRNFSMLWDDEIPNYIEDAIEDTMTISDCPPKPLNDPSFKPSDNPKTRFINNIFIESFDTSNINTQEELSLNFPVDLKNNFSIHKINDDNTQTKPKDPGSTEFDGNTSKVPENRNRNSTIIMQAKTSGNPLKENTKKFYRGKDSGTTPISVSDIPTEITQIPPKTGNADIDIKNALRNTSSNENTSISSDTSKNPSLAEKSSAKSESYIIKTLRRIVGKESTKSIHKEKLNSQDQDSSTDESNMVNKSTSKMESSIIKENAKIDTKSIVTAITQDNLPKLNKKEDLRKEIEHDSSSKVAKSNGNEEISRKTESTVILNPTSYTEIKPVIVNEMPTGKQVPSAPSANSSDFGKFITSSNLPTIITVNTKGTSPKPQEMENKISTLNSIQEPNTDADISSSHNTPDAFNKNPDIEDAKTILINATDAAVKSGAIENHVKITDGLAEGDIHNKCEYVGNDDDNFDDVDDDDDDEEDDEGDGDNPYDVD